MKSPLLAIAFTLFLQPVLAQRIDSLPQPVVKDYNYYKKKQKSNRTGAWLLLGAGLIAATAGIADGLSDWTSRKGEFPFYAGSAAMLGSIPLFIAAGKNKRKARAVRN